ncbi:8554_t:CDS:10 [Gigaspora rosea]|nr:8554_t:CDS:10 [Gigaspora rosea]
MLTINNTRKNSLIHSPGGEALRLLVNGSCDAGVNNTVAQATFNEKKWVWVEDKKAGYVAGYITRDMGEEVEVRFNDHSTRIININETDKMNPPKFDKVEDMADLTFLNEASTYSGLFLVAVNPYQNFPIYTDEIIRYYKNGRHHEMPPHIYAIADSAYNEMLQERQNQVIQYIAAIAGDSSNTKILGKLELQILQTNPILEAFGNALTIRNNNSSRFGKFIRIEFNSSGQIVGANIERYLFEKSRVTYQTSEERNFHIFYQLIRGASPQIKNIISKLLLNGSLNDYRFTKNSLKDIEGVNDSIEYQALVDAMNVVGISEDEQIDLFRVIAAVLHLGNIEIASSRNDQAQIYETSASENVCNLLSIPVSDFIKGLLNPQVKAGREWVTQARTKEQVLYSIEALAKSLYERSFFALVDRINKAIYRPNNKSQFIGVLDIAGFEIFKQEEYKLEGIEWKFIDFGLDLQPTIDLIEKANPIGILSCLDEECVMPKATDKTFVEKLHSLWKDKSSKYQVPRFQEGFILQHYAAKVEYKTSGWLDKNKDPLNENITKLLARSSNQYISSLFSDYLGDITDNDKKNRVKRGVFRTVGRHHKDQLHSLMQQLYSTHPHFVRCIVPNEEKCPGKIDVPLVLDQLRCNGVLEGIRICRAGFPNRLSFDEFRRRYEILTSGIIPKGFINSRDAAEKLLDAFKLDNSQYRIGTSKIFFRSGVLAELEEIRDTKLFQLFADFQAHCRGWLSRKAHIKRNERLRAALVIQRNIRAINALKANPWWKLFLKVRPTLNCTKVEELKRQLRLKDERILINKEEILKQTLQREIDLEDEVKGLNDELNELEGKFEQLSKSKKLLENQMKENGFLNNNNSQTPFLAQQDLKNNNHKEIIKVEHSNIE